MQNCSKLSVKSGIRNNLKMMSKQPGFQTTREDMHDAADHDMEKENNNKSSF